MSKTCPENSIEQTMILEVPRAFALPPRAFARNLWFRGYDNIEEIATMCGVPSGTVRTWKARDNWENLPGHQIAAEAMLTRWCRLMAKPEWDSKDVRDIDLMGRQFEREAKIRRYEKPDGHTGDLNDKVNNRNKGPRKPPKKNYIDAENRTKLLEEIKKQLYEYQQEWVVAGIHENRFILKSRQIGATYAFALESLQRGLETGYNQIFISASKNQAKIFRNYIVKFVLKVCDIKLDGDPMILRIEGIDEMPEFHFLGTNYHTAQGYSGDVYLDEVFWVYGFIQIYNVATAIATLKDYRITLFSTPSTINHEAYRIWNGDQWNEQQAKSDRVEIIIDGEGIKKGILGGDGIWRQKVTIYDALEKGNNEINIEKLKKRYAVNVFDNLFMCQFLDDSKSCFPYKLIHPSMVDTHFLWKGFNPWAIRQKHLGKAWLAIDPAYSAKGDPAALIVVLPPSGKQKKFKVVEKVQLLGADFEVINKEAKKLFDKFDIEKIVVDTSEGNGAAVHTLIAKWFPIVQGVNYTPMLKGQMVLKAQNVFRNNRIEFDAGWTDLAAALLSIYPDITKGGEHVTYKARRSAKTGHGDLAWALLQALFLEPWDGEDAENNQSFVEIY